MQDVASAEVPHRLSASSVGLADHRVESEAFRSEVCDLEPRTLTIDALVRFPEDDVITSDHVAELLWRLRKKWVAPSPLGRLGTLLSRSAVKAERVERQMRAEMLYTLSLLAKTLFISDPPPSAAR
jgi:hypothetical protein